MIEGGSVTIYVSDMERAVRFYTEVLGLRVKQRGGPGFTAIDAGKGLELGLHMPHPGGPQPGASGGTQVGFNLTRPIDEVVAALRERGVQVDGPRPGGGPITLAFLADPDGNPLYLVEEKR